MVLLLESKTLFSNSMKRESFCLGRSYEKLVNNAIYCKKQGPEGISELEISEFFL